LQRFARQTREINRANDFFNGNHSTAVVV